MHFETARRSRRGPGLTPLIDIVFLLIVFFMLASSFGSEAALSLRVEPPTPASRGSARAAAQLLEVAGDGRLSLDSQPVAASLLAERLARHQATGGPRALRIAASPDAPVDAIASVLAAASEAEVPDVRLGVAGARE